MLVRIISIPLPSAPMDESDEEILPRVPPVSPGDKEKPDTMSTPNPTPCGQTKKKCYTENSLYSMDGWAMLRRTLLMVCTWTQIFPEMWKPGHVTLPKNVWRKVCINSLFEKEFDGDCADQLIELEAIVMVGSTVNIMKQETHLPKTCRWRSWRKTYSRERIQNFDTTNIDNSDFAM